MCKTPWTDKHERVGKIRSSGAVMTVVPAVYVRDLEKELADAQAEIERKDKLIEQMLEALETVAPLLHWLDQEQNVSMAGDMLHGKILAAIEAAKGSANEEPNS